MKAFSEYLGLKVHSTTMHGQNLLGCLPGGAIIVAAMIYCVFFKVGSGCDFKLDI